MYDWTQCSPKELAESYLSFRGAKAEFEAKAAECKQTMDAIEQAMLAHLNETNTDSFKVAGLATVTKTVKTNVSCADWPTFFNWLLARAESLKAQGKDPAQIFTFLQKRVSSTTIKEYMDEVDDHTPPPAVNVMPELGVSVRVSK